MIDATKYDDLLKTANWLEETDLPVAIVLRETLESVEGADAIVFPPTFAKSDKAAHPYQIDDLRKDAAPQTAQKGEEINTCLIDSVGAQANRMEPCFKKPPLSVLVPQIMIRADEQTANLLDVGHRIADAAVRLTNFDETAKDAIQKLAAENNAAPLAQVAPTSLVFGFWDSRDSGYKAGRILSSTIRATNVGVVKRSAQFNPTIDVVRLGLATAEEVPEANAAEAESQKGGDGKDPLSKIGLRSAPAVETHGGVRVFGAITRRTQINLVGLRELAAESDEETLKLRRYLFGLALFAGRAQTNYKLREGCHLVLQKDAPVECSLVYPNGERRDFVWNLRDAYEFAEQSAREFGIGEPQEIVFDKEKAKKAKAEAGKKKNK